MTSQPPTIGRAPKLVQVGERRYRINPLPPRQALRVTFRVAKLLGGSLASLLSGAGLSLPDVRDEHGDPMVITMDALVGSPLARMALSGHLVAQLASMTPDDIDALVLDLIVGWVDVQLGAAWVPILSAQQIDIEVADQWELLGLARFAFELNMLPTSADDATGDESSADAAPTTQTGT
jgi:hypothetical protein